VASEAILSQRGVHVHRTEEINTFLSQITELGSSTINLCSGGGAAQS